jgi:putative transposase
MVILFDAQSCAPLMVVPSTEASLREGIASLHQTYTRLINKSHSWSGHLWQGRFFSCPVEPKNTAIVARYIELNPVRAKICENPRQYPWSSAEIACGGGVDGRSGFAPIYSPNGSWEEFLNHGYKNANERELDEIKKIRSTISSGKPFGSHEFLKKIERETGIIVSNKSPGRRAQPEALNDDLII